jgi:hypothetical protein
MGSPVFIIATSVDYFTKSGEKVFTGCTITLTAKNNEE